MTSFLDSKVSKAEKFIAEIMDAWCKATPEARREALELLRQDKAEREAKAASQ